jgi:hypothetical protein
VLLARANAADRRVNASLHCSIVLPIGPPLRFQFLYHKSYLVTPAMLRQYLPAPPAADRPAHALFLRPLEAAGVVVQERLRAHTRRAARQHVCDYLADRVRHHAMATAMLHWFRRADRACLPRRVSVCLFWRSALNCAAAGLTDAAVTLVRCGSYHCGFNVGFNVAEAVNFGFDDWLEHGLLAKSCFVPPLSVLMHAAAAHNRSSVVACYSSVKRHLPLKG